MGYHRRLLAFSLAGFVLGTAGCAATAPNNLVRALLPGQEVVAEGATQTQHKSARLDDEQPPDEQRGFFARILPASWFVAEGERPEDVKTSKAQIQYKLGVALEHKGELFAAEEAYEEAVRIDPEHVGALMGLARVYQRTGRADTALEIYDRLAKIDPSNPAVWNDWGLCYKELGDLASAESRLRKAVELDPMRALSRNNLAMVLAELGYEEEAWEQFRQAVGPARAHYNLAVLAWEHGDIAGAKHHLEQALALDPSLQEARDLLEKLGRPGPIRPAAAEEVTIEPVREEADVTGRPRARVLGVRPAF